MKKFILFLLITFSFSSGFLGGHDNPNGKTGMISISYAPPFNSTRINDDYSVRTYALSFQLPFTSLMTANLALYKSTCEGDCDEFRERGYRAETLSFDFHIPMYKLWE